MSRIMNLILGAILILGVPQADAQQAKTPQSGESLPLLAMAKPAVASDLKYLGLTTSGKTFTINEIKAEVVLIEIFSMYCPYCQAEAPDVNKLQQLIEADRALRDKIKIVGIGVGNSLFETGIFKKKYNIAFPLIPDEDFRLHKILGETRTPYFIAVKLKGNKPPEVIYSQLGALTNIDKFLAQLAGLAGLK